MIKSCQLLDGFGILVQFLLVITVTVTLFIKRSTEVPKRPFLVWLLDTSKQFIGAGMIHCINIAISYSASQPSHGPTTNMCVWYFLNLAIDTTLGVFILWCWMTLFSYFNYTRYHKSNSVSNWCLQLSVFLFAEILTKICLYEIVINSPWLFWLGEKCISWTDDNERYQVLFVMLIFPLVMNAIQFWFTDNILLGQNKKRFDYYIHQHTETTPLISPKPLKYDL